MVKRRRIIGLVFLCLLLFILPAYGKVLGSDKSSIAWYMHLYGFDLTESIIEKMNASHSPVSYDCGPVQITLSELLYDGRWLYTSAAATPSNPETAIIMPGSAERSSKISGGYNENLRSDDRSFLEAAIQEEKQLLSIYVYPIEFEQSPYYFLDHRQDAGNRSTLFSGAIVPWNGDQLTFHLSVQIYEVNVITGVYSLFQEFSFPHTVYPLGPLMEKSYTLIDHAGDDLPFNSIILIQSPLTTYAIPNRKSDGTYNNFEFFLTDEAQVPLPHGAPPESDTYSISQFPDLLHVALYQSGAKQFNSSYIFLAEHNANSPKK